MTDQPQLSDAEYKEYVTGSPAGIQYRVEDPVTGLEYDFDGFARGHLIWTVADYGHQFDGIGELVGGIEQAYVESARLQAAVRQGYPIMWCAQRLDDAERLQAVLDGAAVEGIVVVHEPVK